VKIPWVNIFAFLYENEYSKNRVLSAFFDESAASKASKRIYYPKILVVIVVTILTILYPMKNFYTNPQSTI
jgi:hypothetical protein